jgi:hypothetical protein
VEGNADFYDGVPGAVDPDASSAGKAGYFVRSGGRNCDDQWKTSEPTYERYLRCVSRKLHGIGRQSGRKAELPCHHSQCLFRANRSARLLCCGVEVAEGRLSLHRQQSVDIHLLFCADIDMPVCDGGNVEPESRTGSVTGGILTAVVKLMGDV